MLALFLGSEGNSASQNVYTVKYTVIAQIKDPSQQSHAPIVDYSQLMHTSKAEIVLLSAIYWKRYEINIVCYRKS